MKKRCAIAVVCLMVTLAFAGCRDDMGNDTTSKAPATTTAPQTTLLPSPEVTLPIDTTAPEASGAKRPSAGRPRY